MRKVKYADLPEAEKVKARAQSRKYSKEHRSELNQWAREYRLAHPEWAKATAKRARQKLKREHPEHLMWMEVKKRANARGIPFELEVSDIVLPKLCPILGIELRFGEGRVHDASPSLDRLIPSRGYVRGNCFVISSKANRMKQENTMEDFLNILKYLQDRLPQ